MPMYTFSCADCAREEIVVRPIAKRDDPRPCSRCGGPLRRHIEAGQGLLRSGPRESSSGEKPKTDDSWEAVQRALAEDAGRTGGILIAGKNNRIDGASIAGPMSLPGIEVVGSESDVAITNSRLVDTPTAIGVRDGAKISAENVSQTFSKGSRRGRRRRGSS
jgi:putative FmdB family regulatory protein